jgi:hypothetical protein
VDLGQVGGRAQVLGQAGTAEGKAGLEVGLRDVELRVLAHQVHHLEGIDAQRVAQPGGFVGEGDLERVEVVAAVLHHLGRTHRGLDEAARQLAEQLAQRSTGKGMVGADDGERRLVVVADRRAFAQELGLESRGGSPRRPSCPTALDDRAQHVFDGTRHQRRAEDDDMRRRSCRRSRGPSRLARRRIAPWSWLPLAADGVPTQTREMSLSSTARCASVVTATRPLAATCCIRSTMPSSTTGCLAGHDQVELGGVDVDADHLVAIARQAGQRHGTHVAQAEDADLHAFFPFLAKVLMQRAMMPSSRCIECGPARHGC